LAVEAPKGAILNLVRKFARGHGIATVGDYRAELKLVTREYKYWLCTKGLAPGLAPKWSGVLENWTAGYVTMKSLMPDEHGDCSMWAYGPDSVQWLQGLDYLEMLRTECDRLTRLHRQQPSWETAKELDATCEEVRQVIASLKQAEDEGD
jgi:hypothetical protein